MSSFPRSARAAARFPSEPVDRSSMTSTACPSASSRSTSVLPMNPAPPVTRCLVRGNQPSPFDYYLVSGTGIPRLLRGDAIGSQSVTGVNAPSIGTLYIVLVVLQSPIFMVGASATHYLDGSANGTGTINPAINDLGDPVSIGSRGNFGTAMHGDYAEILLFNSAVSSADRQSLDLYLGNKYAILLGPVPKISVGQVAGGTLPLSWPTPNLTYVLESTPSLSSPVWTTAPNTVTTANGTNTVSISTTNNLQFFRLHKQ